MPIDKTMLDRSGWPAVAVIALALMALCWLALRPSKAPAPLAVGAPPTLFSAARAQAHVATLARAPRPVASTSNAAARRYIVERIDALGLRAEVQTATVQKQSVDFMGNVHVTRAIVNNILVRKPGNGPGHVRGPALLLVAAYDSGRDSQGAANGAASVAALLETLRALQSAAPLANDLICLFADGEAAGELGSQGFAEQHPWAGQIGLVLKFDGGGNRGPLMLVEASGDDGAAIDGWAGATAHPLGSSFLSAVAALLPGTPSANPLGRVGRASLHFANIEGATGQFGSQDTPERLDPGTLQHLGATMLELARHFGALAPASAGRDDHGGHGEHVYFTLPGAGAVHYSPALIWPLTRLVCLLFAGLCYLAVRRAELTPLAIVHGAIGHLFIGVALALCAAGLWEWFSAQHPEYQPRAVGAGIDEHWLVLSFATMACALFIVLQRLLQRAIGVPATVLGAWLCMLLLLLLASAAMPGATYLLSWPLLAAMLAYGALYAPRVASLPPKLRRMILLAGAAPGVLLFVPVFMDVFTRTTAERMNLPIAILVLLLGLGTPLFAVIGRRGVVRTLALACLASTALAHAAPLYAGVLPRPNRMVYFKDTPSWKAYWLYPPVGLDSWSRNFFPGAREPNVPVDLFGWGSGKLWVAPAPPDGARFPYIEVLKDDDDDATRHVEFLLRSDNGAPEIDVWIAGADTLHATLNGEPLSAGPARGWSLMLYGMARQNLRFGFDMAPGRLFRIFIQERIPGLPPNDLPPRSAALPDMTPMTATTVTSDTLVFR
jgi:hypothetical protein